MTLTLPDISPGFFWADQQQQMSPQALDLRQKLALTMAAQRPRGFPKTLGEGLTSLGEAIGQRRAFNQLAAQEQQAAAYSAAQRRSMIPGAQTGAQTGAPAVRPTMTPGSPNVITPTTPQSSTSSDDDTGYPAAKDDTPVTTGPQTAGLDPSVGRDNVALALTAQGVPQPNPTEPGPQAPEEATTSSSDGGPAASALPDDDGQTVARQNAIAGMETGGRRDAYQTVGVPTTYHDGTIDRPYGRYQVMGKNIPSWTQAALGQPMSPADFLANPDAQDAVFNHRFGGYVAKYGEEGAARAWFGGQRGMNNLAATDVLGTRLGDYGKNYVARLNGDGGDGGGGGNAPAPRRVQVASLDPAAGVNAVNAVAPPEASDNPPIDTDIPAAPMQVAQSSQSPPPAQSTIVQSNSVGRVPLDPYEKLGPRPIPPPPTPITPLEQRAWQVIADPYTDQATRDQAKAVIQYEQGQRKLLDDRLMAGNKADIAVWEEKAKKQNEAQLGAPKIEAEQQRIEVENAAKKFADLQRQRLGGVDPADVLASVKASAKNNEDLRNSASALANAQAMLKDPNAFTGSFSDRKLAFAKLLTQFGVPNEGVEPTERLQAYLAQELGPARRQLIGGVARAYQEMVMARQAAGADIGLERGSIQAVLDQQQQLNLQRAIEHQRLVHNYSKAFDAKSQGGVFDTYGLPPDVMETLVNPNSTKKLMKGRADPATAAQFDEAYHTPGLAQRMIARELAEQQRNARQQQPQQ
jgi:hypothetical protein